MTAGLAQLKSVPLYLRACACGHHSAAQGQLKGVAPRLGWDKLRDHSQDLTSSSGGPAQPARSVKRPYIIRIEPLAVHKRLHGLERRRSYLKSLHCE